MMLTHSLGRGVRNYPERVALAAAGKRSTFRQLHARVGSIAAALRKVGFEVGDRATSDRGSDEIESCAFTVTPGQRIPQSASAQSEGSMVIYYLIILAKAHE